MLLARFRRRSSRGRRVVAVAVQALNDKSAPAQPAAFGDRQEFGALFQSVHSGGLVLAVAANPAHCGLVAD